MICTEFTNLLIVKQEFRDLLVKKEVLKDQKIKILSYQKFLEIQEAGSIKILSLLIRDTKIYNFSLFCYPWFYIILPPLYYGSGSK